MIRKPLKRFFPQLALFFVALGISGYAQSSAQLNPKDPYEPFNRVMYNFNDVLDRVILKPIATLYNKIMPKPLNKGIDNVFFNIDTIPTVINDVLQANFYQATSDAWRLGINSTIGIGGLFDFASDMGLEPNKEDFGLTLAQWGYTNSNYLVLPFFGPSSPRDAIGLPVDYYLFSIYPHIHPTIQRYELYALGVVNRRAQLLKYQGVMDQLAVDKYVFMRDAYMQHRAYLIQRNKELGDPYLEKNNEASAAVNNTTPAANAAATTEATDDAGAAAAIAAEATDDTTNKTPS